MPPDSNAARWYTFDMDHREKKTAIDGMKDSLYSRAHGPKLNIESRTPLEAEDGIRPPVAWTDAKIDEEPAEPEHHLMTKPPMSNATKFFIGSFLFFIVAAGIGSYMVFLGGNGISPRNIDVQVVASSVVDGGKEATFEIIVDNRNTSPLQLADVSIQYPDGARSVQDETKPLTYERQTIGTIGAGEQVRRTANAVVYGQEGSQQKLQVTLDYSVPGSSSIYQKTAEANFTIGSSPVSVSVNSPTEAIAGQPFNMDVTVKSNSPQSIPNLVLQSQTPVGYTVVSSDPQADQSGTTWRLGQLDPGTSKVVHIVGSIDAQDGDQRVFRFLTGSDAGATDTTLKVPFIIVPQTVTVRRPFIDATMSLAGNTGKVVSIPGGQRVRGSIRWKNNLTTPVTNLEFKLALSGPMLDINQIDSTDGFYQSQDHTITWTTQNDSTLTTVPPGASGSLDYSFATLAPGTNGTVYSNPTVNLQLSVSGMRQGQTGVPESVTTAASLTASVASQVVLKADALHFTGAFQNTGPIPPIPAQPTSYTVVWTVTNSSNTIANATVSAIVPSNVDFLAAQPGSGVQYDKASRTVTWSLGDLKAGAGFSIAPRSASFQVVLLPSATQVNSSPKLTSDAKLSGQDRFAQIPVTVTAPAVTTRIETDPSYTQGMERVQPLK